MQSRAALKTGTTAMVTYVALLRAVNVGGTGKLRMADLKAIGVEAGFLHVRSLQASGNLVFQSQASPEKVKVELEGRLGVHLGKPVAVIVRTASEMAAVLKVNPFPQAAPNHTVAFFLDRPPAIDALDHAVGVKDEEMFLGRCEIFVHYVTGMGKSKLKIPAVQKGTARNMNTIAKLVEIAASFCQP
jgi:uncharacterized protein (DUF1697 family)